MNEHSTPTAIAGVFTEAWTSHDMETAATYLADDVVFDGPITHTKGKQAYIEALSRFAGAVTGVTILAAFGDETQAIIMYDLATGPFGTLVLMSYDWDDKPSWLHSMQLFARELIPALNKAVCG